MTCFFFFRQIRKPLVEKLRRERINSSIEQLKSLLAPEILKQQADSKLEKADILEMTVCFLTRLQQHQPVNSAPVYQGYSRCVQDTVQVSKDEVKMESQRGLLDHFKNLQSSSDSMKQTCLPVQSSNTKEVNIALWRPW